MGLLVRERRRTMRIPWAGTMQWHSGMRIGRGDAVNISPGGAALRVRPTDGARIGHKIALHMDLTPEVQWLVAGEARVIRRVELDDGSVEIGVAFRGRCGV